MVDPTLLETTLLKVIINGFEDGIAEAEELAVNVIIGGVQLAVELVEQAA